MSFNSLKFSEQKDNIDAWVSTVRSQFLAVDCTPLDHNFFSDINRLALSNFFLARVESSAFRYTRNQSSIRQDPRDEIQLTLVLNGSLKIQQDGRRSDIHKGEMVLYESAKPFELEWSKPYQSITLKIPTSNIQATVPLISQITATTISGQQGRCALVRSMLLGMNDMIGTTTEDALVGVESPLLDLLSVTLNTDVIGQSASVMGNQKLRNIQSWLVAHLQDPDLDVPAIACRHAVSVRTLNRLFAQDGTTVGKWLLQKRLQHSYRLLTTGKVNRITDAAYASGFKDLSHFSHAFHQAFGMAPRALTQKSGK